MIRNDYIMKMIAQLVKALQQILRLKESGRHDDAMREIDQAMQRICGLNSLLVNTLSEESLASTLRGGVTIDHGKCLVLAELLKEEGDIYKLRGEDEESFARYHKSLYLYLEAFTADEDLRLPDYTEKIAAVVDELDDYVLPRAMMARLVRYYEREGNFAAAEDAVDLLLEEDDSAEARSIARDLYERLLARSDAELDAGNLSRDEVREGLARVSP
jgi:hypothetical protein